MLSRKTLNILLVIVTLFLLWNSWELKQLKDKHHELVQTTQADKNEKLEVKEINNPSDIDFVKDKGRILTINTDVMTMQIDKKDARIVGISLTDYAKDLGGTDPYRVLEALGDKYSSAQTFVGSENGFAEEIHFLSAKNSYTMGDKSNKLEVVLTGTTKSGVGISKTFIFKRGDYQVKITDKVSNQTSSDWNGRFWAMLQQHKPKANKRGVAGFRAFNGASYYTEDVPFNKLKFADLDDKNFVKEVKSGWLAFQHHYFINSFIFTNPDLYNLVAKPLDNGIYQFTASTPIIKVKAGKSVSNDWTLYAGPEIVENLKAIAPGLDHTVDYGWLWMISIVMLFVLKKIYAVIGNWGFAIILITLCVKALFFRMSAASFKSMAKMRALAPQLKALQDKHGGDKQVVGMETMKLYQREKVNPLGGCLPILVQIPFFIALYYVLIESVELRHAPFMLWINDLSAKDPYYVLPILMGISMLAQQKMGPTPPDKIQANVMMLMPVMMTFLFASFPAGLVLYWLTNNLLAIAQQTYTNRSLRNS